MAVRNARGALRDNPPVVPDAPAAQGNEIIWGRFDYLRILKLAYPLNSLARNLISRNINIPYFNEANHPEFPVQVLFVYAAGRCLMERLPVHDVRDVLLTLEAITPALPNEWFLNADNSRKMFCKGILRFLYEKGLEGGIFGQDVPDLSERPEECRSLHTRLRQRVDEETWEQFLQRVLNVPAVNNAQAPAIPVDDFLTGDTADFLAKIISAYVPTGKNSWKFSDTKTFVLGYIAIAKRGRVSPGKLSKCLEEIRTSLNRNFTDVTTEELRILWDILQLVINENNAQAIIQQLAANIGGLSLRLRLLLDQAARSEVVPS